MCAVYQRFQSTRSCGARLAVAAEHFAHFLFQSTRSCGARPLRPINGRGNDGSFNPRAPAERDLTARNGIRCQSVSIHALLRSATVSSKSGYTQRLIVRLSRTSLFNCISKLLIDPANLLSFYIMAARTSLLSTRLNPSFNQHC